MTESKTKQPSAFFTIVKLLLRSSILGLEKLSRKKDADRKQKIKSAIAIFAIVLGLVYLFIMIPLITAIYNAAPLFHSAGLFNELLTLLYAISGFVVLIFSIITMLSMLYFSRDTEFFLSLPVRPSTIFSAKLFVVYATELVIDVLIMLPLLIAVGISVKMSAFFYLVSLIGILVAPALPLLIASIISIPLMYVVGFFRNKGALTSVIVIVLFGVFFGFYFYFIMRTNPAVTGGDIPEGTTGTGLEEYFISLITSMSGALKTLSNAVYPLLALARLSTLTKLGSLSAGVSALINAVIIFGSVAALSGLAILISGAVYKRGAAAQLESGSKKTAAKGKFQGGSQLKALVINEWRGVIRVPSFAYQCLMNLVMTPLLVAVFAFSSMKDAIMTDTGDLPVKEIFGLVLFGVILMFGAGTNYGASSAITREGKTFIYSKMLPIPYKTQVLAKVILNTATTFIAGAVSLIIATIATGSVITLLFGLVAIAVYSYGYTVFCVYFDLRKPKLDWILPNEAIKHNFRIIVPFFVNMLISPLLVVAMVLCLIFIQPFTTGLIIGWLILIALSTVASVIFHKALFNNCDRLYEQLTV